MNIETGNTGIRILLCLPLIMYCLLFAIGSWQFAKLLRDIVDGQSFNRFNYRRVNTVGLCLIGYQLLLLIYSLFAGYWVVRARYGFTETGDGPAGSISFKPDYDFSFTWLGIGIMLMIISLAFKTGDELKQDQDLTI